MISNEKNNEIFDEELMAQSSSGRCSLRTDTEMSQSSVGYLPIIYSNEVSVAAPRVIYKSKNSCRSVGCNNPIGYNNLDCNDCLNKVRREKHRVKQEAKGPERRKQGSEMSEVLDRKKVVEMPVDKVHSL